GCGTRGKEPANGVEAGRRGGDEVRLESGVLAEPRLHLRGLVRPVHQRITARRLRPCRDVVDHVAPLAERQEIVETLEAPQRGLTATMLYEEMNCARYQLSCSTVSATLRQFEQVGLLAPPPCWWIERRGFSLHWRISHDGEVGRYEAASFASGLRPACGDACVRIAIAGCRARSEGQRCK